MFLTNDGKASIRTDFLVSKDYTRLYSEQLILNIAQISPSYIGIVKYFYFL